MERLASRRLLVRRSVVAWAANAPALRVPVSRRLQTSTARPAELPTVFSLDFWRNLVPKAARSGHGAEGSGGAATTTKVKSKEWNPATFFIFIFLFIGSMSINQIVVRIEHESFTEKADVKIARLRDVIERLHKGEDVNVQETLGTGNPTSEKEWKEMLDDLQNEKSKAKPRGEEKGRHVDQAQRDAATKITHTQPAPSTKNGKVSGADFY